MNSSAEKNSAIAPSKASLLRDLTEMSKLDFASAKQQLEVIVCNGACEGWLFESPKCVEDLMFHLIMSLYDASTGRRCADLPNERVSEQAQECLVEIALFFFHANPNKDTALQKEMVEPRLAGQNSESQKTGIRTQVLAGV